MSGIWDVEDRLRRLKDLRDRIDGEILAIERRADERVRSARSLAAHERRVQLQKAVDERLKLAPPTLVRRWAKTNGYEVGDRGRLPVWIREEYLEAHKLTIPGGSVDRSVSARCTPPNPPAGTPGEVTERSTDLPASEAS